MFYKVIHYKENIDELAADIRWYLQHTKILHLVGVDKSIDLHDFYQKLSELVGEVVPIDEDATTGDFTGKRWMDVKYDPSMNYFRYSNAMQHLHTDAAYIANPAEIAFLICIKQAPSGGESIFLNSYDLLYQLNCKNPELLKLLETVPIQFGKGQREKRIKPVITYDDFGPLLNWNYYRVEETEPDKVKLTDDFHQFLIDHCGDMVHKVLLEEGESFFFHDERVFHGRTAFQASKEGDRLLLKGGLHVFKDR